MYVCKYVYVCMCVCVCMHVCMYVHMYICMHVCMYICIYLYVCKYVSACVCVYVHVHTYTHMHVHTCAELSDSTLKGALAEDGRLLSRVDRSNELKEDVGLGWATDESGAVPNGDVDEGFNAPGGGPAEDGFRDTSGGGPMDDKGEGLPSMPNGADPEVVIAAVDVVVD